jgi:hypothetical protein
MAMDDLYKALTMFKDGVKELQTSRVIAGANEEVQRIKASEQDEQKKRAALTDVSNQLVSRLAGSGVPASTIQQVASQFAPKTYASADQMIAEGFALGDDSLIEKGKSAALASRGDELAYLRSQQEHQLKLKDQELAAQKELFNRKLAAATTHKKAAGQKQSTGDVSFETNASQAMQFISQLEETVKKSGTWESRLGDPESAARIESLPYKIAITYAKIVDPESVAREGEVEAAKKYMLNLGLTSSKKVALQNLKDMKAEIANRVKTRQQVKAKGGPQVLESSEEMEDELSDFWK